MCARSLRRLLSVTVVALLVVGCGDSGDNGPDTALAESVTTSSSTATSSTAAMVEGSTTSTSGTSTLVYVAMGDSLGISPDEPDGVIWQYTDRLERHFGADVDLRNRVVGSLHSSVMLEQLRTDEKLRAELAEAYMADTDAIIDELVAICGDDTLIRLYDNFMINTGYKLETGTLDISNPYWKAGMDHVEVSAARHGIPVAQVYDEFMGPQGTDDPYIKGLLDEDQLHPNATGAALIADLLNALGYVN